MLDETCFLQLVKLIHMLNEVDTYAFRKDLNALKKKVKTVRSWFFCLYFIIIIIFCYGQKWVSFTRESQTVG